jgi:hypothetical protein
LAARTCTAPEDHSKKTVPVEQIEFQQNLAEKDSNKAAPVKMGLSPVT